MDYKTDKTMRVDTEILKYLYKNRNDGKYHVLFEELNISYERLIGSIEDLTANGLISRAVTETISMFEDPDPDFDHRITNTKCKITHAGVLYHDKSKETRFNRTLSIIALVISIGTLLFTIIDKVFL